MPFDWFRRQYDDPEDKKPESEASPLESDQAEPAAEENAAAEDYLAWAKAAYQTIQQRQATDDVAPAPETATETPTPVPPAAVPPAPAAEPADGAAATEAVPPDAPATEAPTSEGASTEAPSAPVEPAAPTPPPVATEPSAAADTEADGTDAVEPETAPAAPQPFWAESEADRQTRLAQLRETAIAEPAPPPAATPAPTPTEPVPPPIELDEGFLWSAEVLAAQGRSPESVSVEEITWLNRLRQGLDKTRRSLVNNLRAIVGQGPLNEAAVLEIEAALLQSDVGVDATDAIIEALQDRMRDEVLPPDEALRYLKQILRDMLDAPLAADEPGYCFAPQKDVLNIWLITGVNGAGKTTTIGKLAHIAKKSGYNCLIAAADTFRAAAVEQIKVWGDRSAVEVIANPGKNTDPAAVVFDAIAAAQARGTELLLVDTAGRLQNKKNLMEELGKIRRVIDRKADNAVVESLLVLDSTLGQNGLRQAEVFSEVAGLSGVVLTKLDGTAKGGVALAVVQQLGLPIRFIGAGEGIEDLRPFSSYEFVEALLNG